MNPAHPGETPNVPPAPAASETAGTGVCFVVEGSPIVLDVHGADAQDRDGAPPVILEMLEKTPRIERLFADGGYAGSKLDRV